MYKFGAPDKRRPVLVVSRQALLDVLHTAIVVPITSTIRGIPTEVLLGIDEGLKRPCCANVANIETVRQDRLSRFVGVVRRDKLERLCAAIAIASGCD